MHERREYKYEGGVLCLKCTKCGKWYTVNNYPKDKAKFMGVRSDCKKCHREKMREFHKSWYENNKDYSREYFKKYRRENNEERNNVRDDYEREFYKNNGFSWSKFHHKARRFIKKHSLKPTNCPICGRDGNIEMHHPSYSNFEKRSYVVFCCRYCHSAIHDGVIECPKPMELLECKSPTKDAD